VQTSLSTAQKEVADLAAKNEALASEKGTVDALRHIVDNAKEELLRAAAKLQALRSERDALQVDRNADQVADVWRCVMAQPVCTGLACFWRECSRYAHERRRGLLRTQALLEKLRKRNADLESQAQMVRVTHCRVAV
jgi:DNA repair exonuclease SbcCD ATPase subunit